MYNIVVLVKQVPDTKNVAGDAMKSDGTINRSALPTIFNPEDIHALEMALSVKDSHPDAKIHVMTMGPAAAVEVLRESIYRGADHAYLISDRRFAASDTLATSYVLSQGIKKLGKIDLVFAGRQAIDGDTAQVGPQVAQTLGMPQVTYVEKLIDSSNNTITVRKQIEGGHEIQKLKMPALLTVLDTAPHPRPRDIATTVFRRKEVIPVWSVEDIGADVTRCGVNGSPTWVYKIASVVVAPPDRTTKVVDWEKGGMDEMLKELITTEVVGGKNE